jgi:hypothetical protein
VEEPKQIAPTSTSVDLDRLARAVAIAETGKDGIPCVLGYGKMYNNCFGIKNGNTAPCPKVGKSNMCIYDHPEQSYEAFKKIWGKWYVTFPTPTLAARWTGNDNPHTWIANVSYYYYQ